MRLITSRTATALVLPLSLCLAGCLSTLGSFRGAETVPKGQAEVGGRVVTNGWAWAGVGSARFGVSERVDIEGLAFAGRGYEGETGAGVGMVITHQLPGNLDWLAVGVNGVVGYAEQIGGRVIAGRKVYVAFEHNFRLGSDLEHVNMVMVGARLGDYVALEIGAFPIPGENDAFVHGGLAFLIPIDSGRP